MKKIYFISIAITFVIFLIASFLPSYYPIYFYTKHISLFMLVSLIFIGILMRYYRKLESKYDSKKYIIKTLTVISFAVLIFGFSEVQMIYIDIYETPPVAGCSYYDSYGNLIYDTIIPETCGELAVNTYTSNKLDITVTESLSDEYWLGGWTDSYDIFPDEGGGIFSGIKRTDITVIYDDKGRIVEVMLKSSTNYDIVGNKFLGDDHTFKFYNSYRLEVVNEYYEDSFKSTQKEYYLDDDIGIWSLLDEVIHYDFIESEATITILESKVTTQAGDFKNFGITKETFVDGESVVEVIGGGHIQNTEGEYYKEITLDIPFNPSFGIETQTMFYVGENSFKETLKLETDEDIFIWSIKFQDYRGIKKLHKVRSYDFEDQDPVYNAKNSYSRTQDRIYTQISNSSVGIIEPIEFGNRFSYYDYGESFFDKDFRETKWKINLLSPVNKMGGRYNLYRLFDYEYSLREGIIYVHFVHEDNPLISVYYD